MSYVTHAWVMSHTHELCHTHMKRGRYRNWVMSHMQIRHVSWLNESCRAYGWVMPQMRSSHGTHIKDSCVIRTGHAMSHTHKWVMSHVWMSHVAHMNESWVIRTSHVTHMKEAVSPIYIVARLIHSCNTTYSMREMFDMTHSFMWHDLFMYHPYILLHIWISYVAWMNESCRA